MADGKLCSGSYDRTLQTFIETGGATSRTYPCSSCHQMVLPVRRENGWEPMEHYEAASTAA